MPKKEPGFAERLQTAAKAKTVQLEKVRARAATNDPQATEWQAARIDTAEARKIRTAERKQSNRAAAQEREAQRAAEKARQAQALADEKARKDLARIAQGEAAAALKKDQKAARDVKYAARTARQK